ncbi:MAG TPA: APC family permease [Thermoanaerobaculia bacterium]|nr:APC family permease [Thermoanaerobaculia bacterium]
MSAGGLRRRLGLADLALAQVLLVVGTNWFGLAATQGGAGLVLWLLALVSFHLPLAKAVIHLTRACPEEGGIYEWVRRAFGPGAGFLAGWSFWFFALVYTAAGSLGVVTSFAYAFLPSGSVESPALLLVGVPVVLGLVTLSAFLGLGVARFLHGAASLGLLAVVALLGAQVVTALAAGQATALAPAWPKLDLPTLAVFLKLAVYGLAGLECLSILAGEVHAPEKNLPRSVMIAAPANGLIYLLGTAAVLVGLEGRQIDLVNPVAQVLATRGGPLATAVLLLLVLRDLGVSSQTFAANARLPMVAGWDHLLPPSLGRLDRRGIPVRAVLLCGVVSALLGLAAVVDAGRQEAFQLLLSVAGILFGLFYLALFALPLFGARRLGLPRSLALSAAALVGLVMTALFLALSIYPVIEVVSPGRFALRVLAALLVVEVAGLALYWRQRRRR